MQRSMSRVLPLGVLIYLLLLVGLGTLNGALLAIVLPLVIYLGAGLLYGPAEVDLETSRTIHPNRADPDSIIDIKVTIYNKGSSQEQVLIEDLLPHGLEKISGVNSLLIDLPKEEIIELAYQVKGQRGLYPFRGIRVTAGDRLGIFRLVNSLDAPGQILILPETPRLKRVAIRPRQTRVYAGSIPAREGGSGVEFFGVRGYMPGDPLRHINWRVSARHTHRLFSNEFEQERAADVGLILDARRRSDIVTGEESLFEFQVIAAAAVAQALLNEGNRVSLLVYGAYLDWTYPGYGKIQRERILHALARAQTGDSMVFDKLEKLPTRVFPPHSQIVLFSSLLRDDLDTMVHLRALGYQLLVISPDPVRFMQDRIPIDKHINLGIRLARLERTLLLNRLHQAGIRVLSWDVSLPFDQAMQAALSRVPPWFRSYHMAR